MRFENKNRGIIIFLILLISLIGYFSYQNVKDYNNLKEAFLEEKIILESDLDKIIRDYDKIIDKNVKLESDLKEKRQVVIELRDSLNKLKENNFELIRAFRAKIITLEEENSSLFLKIDYLNNANNALLEENGKVKKLLLEKERLEAELKERNQKLNNYSQDLQEKIDDASRISIASITVDAMRLKADEKYLETIKYRKTDAFKVTFKLKENKVAKSGDKKVYISVFNENDEIISEKGEILLKNGSLVPYSSIVNFRFNNSEISLFSFINVNNQELEKGNYYFKIFSEGSLVENSLLTLK